MIVIFTVMREENIEILRLPDGGVYTGAVNENGLPQSSDGTCAWGKQAYVGGWIDGKMSGLGTWYESGQVKYRGFWWEGELVHKFAEEDARKPDEHLPKNKNKIAVLLVGNDYPGTDDHLPNCVNEVRLIGKKLREIGADVTVLENASQSEIEQGLEYLRRKDFSYDHAIFYFSGHGTIYGGYHWLQPIIGKMLALETNVLQTFYESKFKNIIIVHDACNNVTPISQDVITEIHKEKQMIINNHFHDRSVLYAFSSLNGNYSFSSKNQDIGMYALAFLENVQKKNLPVLKMFDNISRFVVDYSKKTKDGVILELPHVEKAIFNDDFCLYDPEE